MRKVGEFLEHLKDLKEETRHLMKLLFDKGVGGRERHVSMEYW
jgi:hypothetical protein